MGLSTYCMLERGRPSTISKPGYQVRDEEPSSHNASGTTCCRLRIRITNGAKSNGKTTIVVVFFGPDPMPPSNLTPCLGDLAQTTASGGSLLVMESSTSGDRRDCIIDILSVIPPPRRSANRGPSQPGTPIHTSSLSPPQDTRLSMISLAHCSSTIGASGRPIPGNNAYFASPERSNSTASSSAVCPDNISMFFLPVGYLFNANEEEDMKVYVRWTI